MTSLPQKVGSVLLWKDLNCPYPWSHGFTFQADGGKLKIRPMKKVREDFFVLCSKGLFHCPEVERNRQASLPYINSEFPNFGILLLWFNSCTCRGYQALTLLHGYLEERVRLLCEHCSLLENSGLLWANLLACRQKNMLDLSQLQKMNLLQIEHFQLLSIHCVIYWDICQEIMMNRIQLSLEVATHYQGKHRCKELSVSQYNVSLLEKYTKCPESLEYQ